MKKPDYLDQVNEFQKQVENTLLCLFCNTAKRHLVLYVIKTYVKDSIKRINIYLYFTSITVRVSKVAQH